MFAKAPEDEGELARGLRFQRERKVDEEAIESNRHFYI